MPFQIGWIDEKLHIYDIVLSDPFTSADLDCFFGEFFRFMDDAPVPLYGLFDVSRWSQSGAAALADPRFRKMGIYSEKIVVIVMVTKNTAAAAMARLGAAMIGYRDWMRFKESREVAIKYLKERAIAELEQSQPAPQVSQTPEASKTSQESQKA